MIEGQTDGDRGKEKHRQKDKETEGEIDRQRRTLRETKTERLKRK